MTSLTQHLHAFVRDIRPSTSEWQQAIDFLTATGQKCDDTRQEFSLLSDVLGVSMLVEAINDRNTPAATVLGPFHVVESPPRELGDTIDLIGRGKPCVVTGRVPSQDGSPLPGARGTGGGSSPNDRCDRGRRHLIADRLDITGARWGLAEAEAVLRQRAFVSNGDHDAYWRFHAACERQRLYPTPDQDQYEFMA
jgi:hypothetical protein